jgi:hypothetical protein
MLPIHFIYNTEYIFSPWAIIHIQSYKGKIYTPRKVKICKTKLPFYYSLNVLPQTLFTVREHPGTPSKPIEENHPQAPKSHAKDSPRMMISKQLLQNLILVKRN